MGSRAIDIAGQTFGRLRALKLVGVDRQNRAIWLCECACGSAHKAVAAMLRIGNIRSCGCARRRHGHSVNGKVSRTYKTWEAMRRRCLNPSDSSFSRYGGAGIKICEEWSSFETFLADMGKRPRAKTLDRIDPFGNYCKENCRWATNTQQQRNRRDARKITADGETRSIQEWASRLRTTPQAIAWRIKSGWPLDKAVTHKIRPLRASTS
jgi:hypothetical protein